MKFKVTERLLPREAKTPAAVHNMDSLTEKTQGQDSQNSPQVEPAPPIIIMPRYQIESQINKLVKP